MGACCAKADNSVAADGPHTRQFISGPTVRVGGVLPSDKETGTLLFSMKAEDKRTEEEQGSIQDGDIVAYHSKSAVKVAVHVRPLLASETAKNSFDCTTVDGRDSVKVPQRLYAGGPVSGVEGTSVDFSFDRVYKGPGMGRLLFKEMTEPVLSQYLKGFNATVFAYGQTGSGKTYTMGTAVSASQVLRLQEDSVIPMALKVVFDALSVISREYSVITKVTYVQIHEDTVKDLLVEQSTPRLPQITLREHATIGIYMDNAREVEVRCLADVAQALEQGNARRTVAAHNLNEFSSRSHAVLQLTLEQKRKATAPQAPEKHKYLQSKLNLVDLAGSERAKDTGTVGQQFSEGVQINQGLLALGNVIAALTEGTSRKHVPYRDSKLTRILQDSLGGTSETLMIACISPASCNLDQTIDTLRYASRARKIQNKLKLNNKFCLDDELAFLRKTLAEKEVVITQLQQENASLRTGRQ